MSKFDYDQYTAIRENFETRIKEICDLLSDHFCNQECLIDLPHLCLDLEIEFYKNCDEYTFIFEDSYDEFHSTNRIDIPVKLFESGSNEEIVQYFETVNNGYTEHENKTRLRSILSTIESYELKEKVLEALNEK